MARSRSLTSTPESAEKTGKSGSIAKRKKVSNACEECRAKKIKCDGRQPVCLPCEKKHGSGAHCTWVTPLKPHEATRTRIAHLQDRIKELEAVASSGVQAVAAESQQSTFPVLLANSSRELPPISEPVPKRRLRLQDPMRVGNLSIGKANHADNYCYGPVGAIINRALDSGNIKGYFGSSIVGNLVSQVQSTISQDREDGRTIQPLFESSKPSEVSFLTADHSHRTLASSIPPRAVTDSLLTMYWRKVQPVFPLLDRSDVNQAYESLWTSQGISQANTTFLCTLNLIFALSLQYSDDPALLSAGSAEGYFLRSKEVVDGVLHGKSHFLMVQIYLMMSLYLHINDPHQTWIAVGMAIRTAQTLGLHLPALSGQIRSLRARELIRKIWHLCVTMDRLSSMTYGRPGMIDRTLAETIPRPLMIDEQLLPIDDSPIVDTPVGPSEMDFFVHSLELYSILHEVLSSVYAPTPQGPGSEAQTYRYLGLSATEPGRCSILVFDALLAKWQDGLPPHLRNLNDATGEVFFRQAMILRQRILHLRTLLLRPALSKLLQPPTLGQNQSTLSAMRSEDLIGRINLQCSIACVQVAQEMIRTLQDWVPSGMLSARVSLPWGYNCLYIYNAATVLVAAHVCPGIIADLSQASIHQSWLTAIELLRKHEAAGGLAKAILTILLSLYDKVSKWLSEKQQQKVQSSNQTNAADLWDGAWMAPDMPNMVLDEDELAQLTLSNPLVSNMHMGAFNFPFLNPGEDIMLEEFPFGLVS